MSTNFDQCFKEISSNPELWTKGGRDLYGNPISEVSQIRGMSYPLCLSQCGSAPEAFKVSIFTNQFSAFMLPFLALTAQLPFGSSNQWDNFSTIPLTIGSPTLAIFSLVITLLNSRWLKRRFARIHYPNTKRAVVVLNNLQQSLLRIDKMRENRPLLASLVLLPENDQWWLRAERALSFTHTWTLSNGASILWAVIAYIFTIVEVSDTSEPPPSVIGPAVGCAWIWLLPLVVGWLFTSPNCEEAKITRRLISLNQTIYTATPTSPDAKLVHEEIGHYPIMVWPPHNKDAGATNADGLADESLDAIPLLPDFKTGSLNPLTVLEVDHWGDEARSSPFFNYARIFPWARNVEQVAAMFQRAAENAHARKPVTASRVWTPHNYDPDTGTPTVHPDNRTGDAAAIQLYVQPERPSTTGSPWAPRVWHRVSVAGAISCACQWLCGGSATILSWRTPTVGLGCHSGSFLLHGIISMVSFLFILAGEVLHQYDHPTTPRRYSFKTSRTRYVLSTLLRRFGKTLAWINALLFIALAVMSFSNLFYNCFCSSSVLGLGSKAYLVMDSTGNAQRFLDWWKACMAVATTSAGLLVVFCWVMTQKDEV